VFQFRKLILATALAAVSSPAFAQDLSGATIFKQTCSPCHQPQGQGVPGAFPALKGDKFVQGDPKQVAHLLLNGRGGMPNFRDDLSDSEIAAVLTFVRSAWGNKAGPLPPGLVAAERAGKKPVNTASSLMPYH